MAAEPCRVIPLRPVIEVVEVSDRLLYVLDAMDGMSDEEAAAYWDQVSPPIDLARVDRNLAPLCADCTEQLCTCDMPTWEAIDASNAEETRRRLCLLDRMDGGGM